MLQKKLGKLEKVPLRDVWPHEALDFTKWLSEEENLKQLGDACSINLEFVGTEQAVGPFSVDIVAKETSSDRHIIIENQLEETNHDHLGKVITYAAGQDAAIAIWIVARAREPHKKAIEWLNEHTDDQHSFFLVEVEAWRIGDSKVAPTFTVVQAPNYWARAEKKKDGLGDTESVQLDYWQTYRELALSDPEFSKVMRPQEAPARHYTNIAVQTSRYHLALLAQVQNPRIGIEVCIRKDQKFGQAVFTHLSELEKLLGVKGETYEAQTSCGIRFYREGCDIKENPDLWKEYIAWQLSAAVKLRQAMLDINKAYPPEVLEQAQ